MKKNTKNQTPKRVLGRRLAKQLTDDQLHAITGGSTSCSCGCPDDSDRSYR